MGATNSDLYLEKVMADYYFAAEFAVDALSQFLFSAFDYRK